MSVWTRALSWDAKRNGLLTRALKGFTYPVSGRITSRRNYALDVGDGTDNGIVEASLNWIAVNFIEAPPAMWERNRQGQRERLNDDEAILALLEEPNPFYGWEELIGSTLCSINVDGNGYWWKIRSPERRVVGLSYLPHFFGGPMGPSNQPFLIDRYEFRIGGLLYTFPVTDIVHFRNRLDPENPRKGRSKLKAVLAEIATDEEASRFTASILRNFGMPGVVVSPEPNQPEPGEEDAKAIREHLIERYSGEDRGKPLFVGASVKVAQFGFSPKDLDLSALRDVAEERVTAALNLPAAVIGFGAGLQTAKTNATYSELRDQAWQNNLIPTGRIIGSTIKRSLAPDFYADVRRRRLVFGFDTSRVSIMADYHKAVAEKHGLLFREGLETRAEGRRAVDLSVGPRDNVYILQSGVVEVRADESIEQVEARATEQQAMREQQAQRDLSAQTEANTTRDAEEQADEEQARADREADRKAFIAAVEPLAAAVAMLAQKESNISVTTPPVNVRIEKGAVEVNETHHIDAQTRIEKGAVEVTTPAAVPMEKQVVRDAEGRIVTVKERPLDG